MVILKKRGIVIMNQKQNNLNPNNFSSQSNNQEPTQHSINLFESEYFKSKEEIDKLKTQNIVEQKCKNSRRFKKSSIIWITATIFVGLSNKSDRVTTNQR